MCDRIAPFQQEPYRLAPQQVLDALATNAELGLSVKEAQARLQRYGRNELRSKAPVTAWRKFLSQFSDLLVVLLVLAACISALLWIYERDAALPYEAMAIGVIVLLNATLGFVQQARAERALAALRQMSSARAVVVREGKRQSLPTAEVVPGDIILVEEGAAIPADARLIRPTSLRTAEAVLTGESHPVSKAPNAIDRNAGLGDRTNMIFSGTAATYGHGVGVVTATGMRTEMGRIAALLEEEPEERTPLQDELDKVGKLLGLIVLLIAAVMVATIIFVDGIRGVSALFDVLILGVALAVAAVPEGLPAVVTAVLAIGVQRMAGRKALIRHLAAVETLGSADVIASDKTGTLTRNEMTVRTLVTASGRVLFGGTGYEPAGECLRPDGSPPDPALKCEVIRALSVAERANNAALQERDGRWSVQGDPTEGALIVAARKVGLSAEHLETRFNRIGEIPFSSERKLMSTVHTDSERGDRMRTFTKGAPDVLLDRCTHEFFAGTARLLTAARRAEILDANERLAGEALRTLAVAFRSIPDGADPGRFDEQVEHDLVFLGLIGMIDPPREETRQAVARARLAGIRPIMITGDHPRTAAVIAKELGISRDARVITGVELAAMPQTSLDRAIGEVSVYARLNPEHKLRIVEALQRQGLTVAMTGDGVNDAPALKRADIGIAMGITGTDVSKEAADMVLADDNFATIVAAVEEGRAIFANIRKFLRYLLSSNIGEVMTMFSGILLMDVIGLAGQGNGGLVLPLLATQILWINLVTDGAPALALGVDPADPHLMEQPPRARGEGVLTGRMWSGIILTGVIMAASTLIVLDASLPGGLIEGSGSTRYGQTMAFTTLVLCQLYNVFNARSDEQSAFTRLFQNGWLLVAILLSLALQTAVVYVPFLQETFSTVSLGPADWLICAAAASSVLWIRELSKLILADDQ